MTKIRLVVFVSLINQKYTGPDKKARGLELFAGENHFGFLNPVAAKTRRRAYLVNWSCLTEYADTPETRREAKRMLPCDVSKEEFANAIEESLWQSHIKLKMMVCQPMLNPTQNF
jgi:hypothetical protein